MPLGLQAEASQLLTRPESVPDDAEAIPAQTLSVGDWTALEQAALDAGFDKAGVAAVPLPGSAEHQQQRERFRTWVAQGRAGEMAWLTRTDADGELLRSSLHRAVPWVRSVMLCAKTYNADAPYSTAPSPQGSAWIARYAWSGAMAQASDQRLGRESDGSGAASRLKPTDYHDVLLKRLRKVEAVLQQRHGGQIQTRCYVDTGPVVERHLAQLAGIGWIGKNTCVLDQKLGSWTLLGTILTSLPLARQAMLEPAADRCGSCTRCIDACPTDALIAPRQMDASRCISYLTIEKKGSLPENLRSGMGRQVFGCDICQDVCPWNRRAPIAADIEMQPRPELVNLPLAWLAQMDGEQFNRTFRGSPLERTGRRRVQRNVAIAMGNSGDSLHLPHLQRWAEGDDAMLAEAAAWAIAHLPATPQQIAAPGSPRDKE